jgi:hypothetical protein
MAEVGMRRPARDDQVIVTDFAITQDHLAREPVDRFSLAENNFAVRLAPQDSPNRPCDITRIQCGGRNLVEQGLEQVMVSAIDQCDPHRRLAERTGRGQAAEPAANDHNVWSTHRRFH